MQRLSKVCLEDENRMVITGGAERSATNGPRNVGRNSASAKSGGWGHSGYQS